MSGGLKIRDFLSGKRGSDIAAADSSSENTRDRITRIETSFFSTVLVKDVITNPVNFLNKEYKGLKNRFALKEKSSGVALSDSQLVNLIPRNSIIGYNLSSADAISDKSPELFFPFFSGHLSLPLKPGESVWTIRDQNGRGYWLSRKVSFRQVEDLNYTVASRELNVARKDSIDPDQKNLTQDENNYFKNLIATIPDEGNSPISVDDMVAESIAYKEEFIGEPVPSYSKKCGDLVLQGSNNTLISLGTDRSFKKENKTRMEKLHSRVSETFKAVTDTFLSENDNVQNKEASDGAFKYFKPEMAGCIELVAGRDIDRLTLDDVTVNGRKKRNALSFFELKKFKSLFSDESEEDENEGEFTLPQNNPLARFYVSMRSMPNDNYPSLIKQELGEDTDIKKSIEAHEGLSESAIVGSAYSIKSFAKGNCELQSEAGGSMFISDGVILASKGGAYIHLKPSGDISIVPGKNGIIKLGGEEANLTTLCSDVALDGSNVGQEKTVLGKIIVSSAAGFVGGDSYLDKQTSSPLANPPPNGKFATKILLK